MNDKFIDSLKNKPKLSESQNTRFIAETHLKSVPHKNSKHEISQSFKTFLKKMTDRNREVKNVMRKFSITISTLHGT